MKTNKLKYYLKYTLIFSCFAALVIYYYYFSGKSLINKLDGFREYYRGLAYYSSYIKEFLRSLFIDGKFEVPQWDFAIGEGSDIIQAILGYGFADIFNVFAIFVKEEYLYIYYDFTIFLRMYLMGVVFSELCFYLKNENGIAILSGTMLYAFGSYAVCVMSTHLYFLNAFLYLVIIIYGIERIIKENKGALLTVGVFLQGICDFYFLYMVAVAVVFYVVVRILLLDIDLKAKLNKTMQITIYAVLGVMISAITFLPTLYFMANNARATTEVQGSTLYSVGYFINKISTFTYCDGYFGGYSFLGLFSIIHLFRKKGNKTLKVLLVLCTIFVSFPFFGKMFNGFTYTTERWYFAISLLISYIVVVEFENIISDINKHLILYLIITIVYSVFAMYFRRGDLKIIALLMIYTLVVVIFSNRTRIDSLKKLAILSLCLFNILVTLFFKFSPRYWDYVINGTEIEKANSIMNGEFTAFNDIDDESFYRYSGDTLATNACIHGDISSTSYYWSVANDDVIKFRENIGLSDHNSHHYESYDDSYILNTLGSVKYYIKNENDLVPYSYYDYGEHNGYNVYKTDTSLPLLYTYNSYILKDNWDSLDLITKQEVLTNSVVLYDDLNLINKNNSTGTDQKEIDYELIYDNGINILDNTIDVRQSNASLNINIKNKNSGEYYLVFENFNSNVSSTIQLRLRKGTYKELYFKDSSNPGYAGKHDYAMCIGYYDDIDEEITLTFPNEGKFTYDDIKIVCLPIENIQNNLKELDDANISRLEVLNNKVSADIDLKENKIVCFSIPYSVGWKAYVDGEKVDTLKANVQYIGLPMEKGEHTIELIYSTPLIKFGTVISIMGLISFVILEVYNSKKYHKCYN